MPRLPGGAFSFVQVSVHPLVRLLRLLVHADALLQIAPICNGAGRAGVRRVIPNRRNLHERLRPSLYLKGSGLPILHPRSEEGAI